MAFQLGLPNSPINKLYRIQAKSIYNDGILIDVNEGDTR